jgi:hypothetical protein
MGVMIIIDNKKRLFWHPSSLLFSPFSHSGMLYPLLRGLFVCYNKSCVFYIIPTVIVVVVIVVIKKKARVLSIKKKHE